MSGQGKYTTFVPPNGARSQFLSRIFPGDGSQWKPEVGGGGAPPFAKGGGVFMTQEEAAAAISQQGNDLLLAKNTGGVQQGDKDLFPNGVDLAFSGAPNTAAGMGGSWKNPGDPANSYTPDITGLKPGQTSGTDKNVDPKISATDIVPNYIRTANTANPSETSPKVYTGLTFGSAMKLGSST
jgi:hypothetical protein